MNDVTTNTLTNARTATFIVEELEQSNGSVHVIDLLDDAHHRRTCSDRGPSRRTSLTATLLEDGHPLKRHSIQDASVGRRHNVNNNDSSSSSGSCSTSSSTGGSRSLDDRTSGGRRPSYDRHQADAGRSLEQERALRRAAGAASNERRRISRDSMSGSEENSAEQHQPSSRHRRGHAQHRQQQDEVPETSRSERPHSAWRGASGRRPNFTFSDIEAKRTELAEQKSSEIDRKITRPRSAWRGNSGRRPNFTFSDVDGPLSLDVGGEDHEIESLHSTDSEHLQPTTPPSSRHNRLSCNFPRTRRRSVEHQPIPSLTPISVDRDEHDGRSPTTTRRQPQRRHSLYAFNGTTHYNPLASSSTSVLGGGGGSDGGQTLLSKRRESLSTTNLSDSTFRDRSLTDCERLARMRILARLANSKEPPDVESPEWETASSRARPRKLQPIFSPTGAEPREDWQAFPVLDDVHGDTHSGQSSPLRNDADARLAARVMRYTAPAMLEGAGEDEAGMSGGNGSSNFYAESLDADLIHDHDGSTRHRPLLGRRGKALINV